MNQIEVEVIETQILKSLLASWLDVLLLVECVPQLGSNEELFSLNDAFINSLLDSCTSLLLIAIIASLINQFIAVLDGCVHTISSLILINLPASIPNSWHLGTGVQGNFFFGGCCLIHI